MNSAQVCGSYLKFNSTCFPCLSLSLFSHSPSLNLSFLHLLIYQIQFVFRYSTECAENEHYRTCGPNCEPTCDTYQNTPIYCIKYANCKRGCFCNYGFVRDMNNNGTCVPTEQCRKIANKTPCCPLE